MHTTFEAAQAAGREAGEASRIAAGRAYWGHADFEAAADATQRALKGPPPTFEFTPPANAKARQFLQKRADHLRTLSPAGQIVFLKSAIGLANQAPVNARTTAFDKSLVLITLRTWLEQVREWEGA